MDNVLNFMASTAGKNFLLFTLSVAYVFFVLAFIKVLRRHPTSFTVAILGFPGSGKTVYVTALFDELQQGKSARLKVSPYGVETIEEVARNLTLLGKGQWLPKTSRGNVFFFRAIASLLSGTGRVRLEIADFAGEELGELQPDSERWLHKGDYFKYVVDADAILLAVDGVCLLSLKSGASDEIVNSFVACVQVVADARGAVGSRRLTVPVALLVMKADLLGEDQRTKAIADLARLDAICRTRCRHFEMFFVSSTGPLANGKPPARRNPMQVLEPLEWAFRRATTVTLVDVLRRLVSRQRPTDRDRWERRP